EIISLGLSNSSGGFTALYSGTYNVTVRDANGCISDAQNVTVNEPTPINLTYTITHNITCNGYNDGEITLFAVGGAAPYTFEMLNPYSDVNSTGIFSNYGAGYYDFNVIDINGCVNSINS